VLGLSSIRNIFSLESTSILGTLNPVTAVSLEDKADAQISGDQDIRCLLRNPKSLSCAYKGLWNSLEAPLLRIYEYHHVEYLSAETAALC
jgi:hypothetical protein